MAYESTFFFYACRIVYREASFNKARFTAVNPFDNFLGGDFIILRRLLLNWLLSKIYFIFSKPRYDLLDDELIDFFCTRRRNRLYGVLDNRLPFGGFDRFWTCFFQRLLLAL